MMVRRGFTLIEMLVVIALLGLSAALVIPQMNSVHTLRVQAALRTVVSDLTFAQSDAIAFQQRRAVVFDIPANVYRVVGIPGTTIDPANTLYSPSGPGGRYVVDFSTEQFAGAGVTAVTADVENTVIFDDLGSPVAAPTGDAAGTGARITLRGSGQEFTVVVEPFTGRISVRRVN